MNNGKNIINIPVIVNNHQNQLVVDLETVDNTYAIILKHVIKIKITDNQ